MGLLLYMEETPNQRSLSSDVSGRLQLRDPNGQIVGSCSTGKGHKVRNAQLPALVLTLETHRVILLCYLNVQNGNNVAP